MDVFMYILNKIEVLAGDLYCSAINFVSNKYANRTNNYRCDTLKSYYYGIKIGMMVSIGYGFEPSAFPG